jgi:hypothetical protein
MGVASKILNIRLEICEKQKDKNKMTMGDGRRMMEFRGRRSEVGKSEVQKVRR